ncbi:MAG: hypothetical protein AMS14_10210 [Planctomycetes bacterium DG_20]|nr:MAG: hypothetical protein AMS14_10210 [Planctomycetes bacterium DG_20]
MYSTGAAANDDYFPASGTSMAAANVTGTAVLLIEHYEDLFGDRPLAATTKGLLIHTAFDAGNTGPDYAFGWGLVDAAAAATHLTDATAETPYEWVLENTYAASEWTWDLYIDGTEPLKTTICWTDPAGTPHGPGLDITTPVLVNDLDLWISGPGGTYYPWTLDPANPATDAVRITANHLDNVEQVLIDVPTAGVYTIHVGHTGSLSTPTQNYSLLLSGAAEQSPSPTSVDLAPTSDTGRFSDDDITMLDNTSGKQLDFEVTGTVAGATVTLYLGETAIGSAAGSDGTTTVTTNGEFDLTDGERSITARQTVTGKLPSPDSPALTVWVDTTAPTASVPDLVNDTGVSDSDDITQGIAPQFVGSAEDTAGVWNSGVWKVEVESDDSKSATDDTSPFYDVTLGTLGEGERTVSATVTDVAGNTFATGNLTVYVDRTAPTVTAVELNDRLGRSVSDIDPSGIGVRTVDVTFSEAVAFAAGDATVQTVDFPGGVETVTATLAPTVEQPAPDAMRITLGYPVGALDTWVKVTLSGTGTITDAAGNALDGEPAADSSGLGYIYDADLDLPSGDGTPGGDAVFYVGSLQCDFRGFGPYANEPNGTVDSWDISGFTQKYTAGDLDADFRGFGPGNPLPNGTVDSWDINGFTSRYTAAIANGTHLDDLPTAA